MSLLGAWQAKLMIWKCSNVINYLEEAISDQQSGIELVDKEHRVA